jgi:hypothetical protein
MAHGAWRVAWRGVETLAKNPFLLVSRFSPGKRANLSVELECIAL